MHALRKVALCAGAVAVAVIAATGWFFIMLGGIGYFVANQPDRLVDLMLGISLAMLAAVLFYMPYFHRDMETERRRREEAYRTSLRRGFFHWASQKGLTVTEADAITLVDAQLASVGEANIYPKFQ